MSKAIFLLDEMPKNCFDPDLCPLLGIDGETERYICLGSEKNVDNMRYELDKKPEWCPLKEAPQRHDSSHLTRDEFRNIPYDDMTAKLFADALDIGWNSCLDIILGTED